MENKDFETVIFANKKDIEYMNIHHIKISSEYNPHPLTKKDIQEEEYRKEMERHWDCTHDVFWDDNDKCNTGNPYSLR